MNVTNCRRCGRIFQNIGKPICEACARKEEEDFEVARQYIKENPGRNINEVSEGTGVSVKQLTKFLREKRIEFSDGSGTFITCEGCGSPISSGRYCNACLSKLGREMMESGAKPKPKPVVTDDDRKKEKGMHISKFRNDNSR